MDGKIDFTTRMWTDGFNVVSPLAFDEIGKLLCPLCARDDQREVLSKLPLSLRYYCQRSHFLEAPSPRS